jgi:hypothetical protein
MLFWSGGAVSETSMVTVILLMRASHCTTVLLVVVKYQGRSHHGPLGTLPLKH